MKKLVGFNRFSSVSFCIVACLITLGACKHSAGSRVDYTPGLVEKTSKEFLIPRDLRETIEKEYLAFIHKENIKNVLPDAEILARIPREFLDVDLFFRSSAPGVLVDHTKFSLPRGGGEIDLKNCVKGKKGSFYMNFEARRSHEPTAKLKDLRIYFFSESHLKTIDKDTFGVGCHKYMDVTDLMTKANEGEGLQLNATENRYLPVIGGVFYFVDFEPEGKIYLAAVRILDSRYPAEQCAEF